MSAGGSITGWLKELRVGNSAATDALWQRYFPRLVKVAREKLRGAPLGLADEEDVALSVLNCFCRVAQEGRYPDLSDRDDLWRLLLQITARRAVDLRRHENRQRRGGGQIQHDAIDNRSGSVDDGSPINQVPDGTPTPEFAAMMADECRRLLDQLSDAGLRTIALAKMEGLGNAEIAAQLGCSERTVERRLSLIRDKWTYYGEREAPNQRRG
jgi:RNA polymerase sigma factor (sigma-70 family)